MTSSRVRPLPRYRSLLRRLKARGANFLSASQGIAAVEFAVILPFMVVLYLGMTEITYAVGTDNRVTLLSRTLADLTGRETDVTPSVMDTIFSTAVAVMQPYAAGDATSPLMMVVSSVTVKLVNNQPTGTVCWSQARSAVNGAVQSTGATPLQKGTPVPVPVGFQDVQNGPTSFIRSDVTLGYKPLFGSTILKMITNNPNSRITLGEQIPWPVRNGSEVIMSASPCL